MEKESNMERVEKKRVKKASNLVFRSLSFIDECLSEGRKPSESEMNKVANLLCEAMYMLNDLSFEKLKLPEED